MCLRTISNQVHRRISPSSIPPDLDSATPSSAAAIPRPPTMDFRATKLVLLLLISISLLSVHARADSVVFFDSNHRYIGSNNNLLRTAVEASSMSPDEVAATVSVLLGFAPLADYSSKLNEVLMPDPFNRPRAVLMLEVPGVDNAFLSENAFGGRVVGSTKADIVLPNEDEVSVVALDEDLSVDCDAACAEKELGGIAHLLGGSYAGSIEPLDGELKFPLGSGGSLNLQMTKKADRRFALNLVSLVRNINRAAEIHEDFSGSPASPAELIIGRFTGIKELKEEYGSGDMTDKGEELFQITLTKSLELLQKTYEGKIVGVIFSTSEPDIDSEAIFDVKFSTQSARRLVEGPAELVILEILLVRRSLALITTLILVISTLIGVYFLFNMPIQRDTLLYSNVKFD